MTTDRNTLQLSIYASGRCETDHYYLNCDKRLSLFQAVAKNPKCDKKSSATWALQQDSGKKATFILAVIAESRPPNLHYYIFRYVSLGKCPPKIGRRFIERFSESSKVLHAFDAIDGNKVGREVRIDKGAGRRPSSRCRSFPRCSWFNSGVIFFLVSRPPRDSCVDG